MNLEGLARGLDVASPAHHPPARAGRRPRRRADRRPAGPDLDHGHPLLLPFTLALDPIAAIALLAALYCAGTYGGSITAILINTPGAPPAATTAFDGYPMALKGEAGRALGMAASSRR